MKRAWLTTVATALLLHIHPAYGHAVHGEIIQGGIGIRAVYDSGAPMSGAEIVIHAPDDETPWQEGYADEHGVFLFQPDREGTWRVLADDGMGHRLTVDIEHDGSNRIVAQHAHNHLPRWAGIVLGLLAIRGTYALYMDVKRRRRPV